MTARHRTTALALALAAALAPARPARAYIRALTSEPPYLPVYWSSPCEVVTIYLNDFTQLSSDEVAKSIAAAAQAWSPAVVTCPGGGTDGGDGHPAFEIITQLAGGGSVPAVDSGADGKNSVIFETTTWGDNDPSAIAVTTKNADPSGRIFDADIQVNALPSSVTGYVWANLDPGAPPAHGGVTQMDLQTAITHEFGHFLGLGHTCFNPAVDFPRPLDDRGQPAPDCSEGATIPEAQAVMWYMVDPDSSGKRVITADDARGVCAIYPPTTTPALCAANAPDDGCGCHAGGPRPAAASALLLALAALARKRRRRSFERP
jgi:MYXO-CTERM domain-containing protein